MTVEEKIAELLARAAPLRLLPPDEQGELGALVDQVNALRALPAGSEIPSEPVEPDKRQKGKRGG